MASGREKAESSGSLFVRISRRKNSNPDFQNIERSNFALFVKIFIGFK
jgi:hypothetical protein